MNPQRILLVQLRQIGDVVLTTPIAHILKEARPEAQVDFLTEAPSDQLLAGNPYIDEVIVSDRRSTVRKSLRIGAELRRRRYDVVLDFMANPRSAALSFLTRAPMRIAFPVRGRGLLYTHRVAPIRGYPVEKKKCLLAPLGVESERTRPEIYLAEAERTAGRELRRQLLGTDGKRLITVDPSHRRETRRWPVEHFGRLCALIGSSQVRPVVLWGPGEEELAREVVSSSGGVAQMAPPTRLREMAALLQAADLHAGNCSAPRHMAVAVGTPTFTVLGATSAGWTYPAPEHTQVALGLECQPCNRNVCGRDFACLRDLGPEAVYASLVEWTQRALGWKPEGRQGP